MAHACSANDPPTPTSDRRLFLHETWLGGLLLGLCATATLADQVVMTLLNLAMYSSTKVIDAEMLLYAFTQHPMNFLWEILQEVVDRNLSGGGFLGFDSVDELNSADDLGQEVRTVQ